MRYFLILFLSVVTTYANAGNIEISVSEARKLMTSNAFVIDIRRLEEWKSTGIVPGSVTSTFFNKDGTANLATFLVDLREKVSPSHTLLLICRTGRRTKVAANYLIANTEYKSVYSVSGGITDWKRMGLRTVAYP